MSFGKYTTMVKTVLLLGCLLCLWRKCDAIQCFSCLSNERNGQFCRKISEAQLVNCPDDATFCNALVFLKNGKVNVNRGCAGSVSNWGFGRGECDIMSSKKLMDVGVAFYQCRGDACNNIEPAEEAPLPSSVVLLTKTGASALASAGTHAGAWNKVSHDDSDMDEDNDNGREYGAVKTPKKEIPYGGGEEILTDHSNEQTMRVTPKATPRTTTQAEEEEEQETDAPAYQPKPTTKPPTPKKVQYAKEEEEEEETDAPVYQPKTKPPTIKPPPPPTPKHIEYEEEETDAPAYQPKPTTIAPTKKVQYGGEDILSSGSKEQTMRVTPKKIIIPRTTTQEEAPAYQPRITTTTTTKRRMEYGGEQVLENIETEQHIRPTRRGRTVFDRRRR